jgi:aldose 1-epimerase
MNKTAVSYCFTHTSGKDVFLYTLQNKKGTEVLITNFGAIITSYKIKLRDGTTNDIVLGFEKVEDYLSPAYLEQYPWFGAAVGRNANRIKNAECKIDGQVYPLTKNRGDNQLHGGIEGFDKKVWQLVAQGENPNPFLELQYISPDREEGFPGNLEISIRFELGPDDELIYEYKATCDKATVINCTHHGYFNLDNGKGTIHDHLVKIYGAETLDQDEELVATGAVSPVDNTAFDLREMTRVGDGLEKIPEYDKSYVAAKNPEGLMAEVRSLQSGLLLQVFSTEPIVHFYSGKWIPVVPGKNGTVYGPFSGLCLETHKHPNAVNIPHFPNTILRPGETYHHRTRYRVTQV